MPAGCVIAAGGVLLFAIPTNYCSQLLARSPHLCLLPAGEEDETLDAAWRALLARYPRNNNLRTSPIVARAMSCKRSSPALLTGWSMTANW